MVVKDEVFNTIGIDEGNLHYYCCDDQAYDVLFFLSFLSRMAIVQITTDSGLEATRIISILLTLLSLGILV